MGGDVNIEIPDACLSAMGGGGPGVSPEDVCTGMAEQFGNCEYGGGMCKCSADLEELMGDDSDDETDELVSSGTYTTDGTTLTMTDPDDEEPSVMEYCVDGSQLLLEDKDDDGTMIVVLKKK